MLWHNRQRHFVLTLCALLGPATDCNDKASATYSAKPALEACGLTLSEDNLGVTVAELCVINDGHACPRWTSKQSSDALPHLRISISLWPCSPTRNNSKSPVLTSSWK